jgi:hypothetical protein
MNQKANLIFLVMYIVSQIIILLYNPIILHKDLTKKNYSKLCDKSQISFDVDMWYLGYQFGTPSESDSKLIVKCRNMVTKRKQYIVKISATGSDVEVSNKKPFIIRIWNLLYVSMCDLMYTIYCNVQSFLNYRKVTYYLPSICCRW